MAKVVKRDKKTGTSLGKTGTATLAASKGRVPDGAASMAHRAELQAARPEGYVEGRQQQRETTALARKDLAHGIISPEEAQKIEDTSVGGQNMAETMAPTAGQPLAGGENPAMRAQITELETYRDSLLKAKRSNLAIPETKAQASTAVGSFLPQKAPVTPPEVDNFFAENQIPQQSMSELVEFLSPKSTRKELEKTMSKIQSGQQEAAGLKLELANVERIMDGTEQDIRDEVEKVSGFATDSQVLGLTVGRNRTLLSRAAMIQDQLNYTQDVIQGDLTLLENQTSMAKQQFMERSQIMQFKQKNDEMIYRANQDAVNRNIDLLGVDGLYDAAQGDPIKISRIERTMGLVPGSLQVAAQRAKQARIAVQQEQDLALRMKEAQLNNEYLQGANLRDTGANTRDMMRSRQYRDSLAGANQDGSSPGSKPIKYTATQIDTLNGFEATLSGATKALDLLNLGTQTGPISGRTLQAKKMFGGADPNQVKLEQGLSKLKADFMKTISGAAVSESEATRLAKFLPEITDQEDIMKSKLENLLSEAARNKSSFLRILGSSGGMGTIVVGPDGNEYEIIDEE